MQSGHYQHYKGGLYEVIGEALHSETHEKFVIYRALYDSEKFPKDTIWIRPLKMFEEEVEVDGRKIPRFRRAL